MAYASTTSPLGRSSALEAGCSLNHRGELAPYVSRVDQKDLRLTMLHVTRFHQDAELRVEFDSVVSGM